MIEISDENAFRFIYKVQKCATKGDPMPHNMKKTGTRLTVVNANFVKFSTLTCNLKFELRLRHVEVKSIQNQ